MANRELCIKCRYQETDHDVSPEETCGDFESEVRHQEDCPVIDCNGDCEAAIIAWDRAVTQQAQRMSKAWFLEGPFVVLMDIGS